MLEKILQKNESNNESLKKKRLKKEVQLPALVGPSLGNLY